MSVQTPLFVLDIDDEEGVLVQTVFSTAEPPDGVETIETRVVDDVEYYAWTYLVSL